MPYSKIKRGIILAIVLAVWWIPKSEAEQNYCPTCAYSGAPYYYNYGTNNNPVAVDIVATEKDKQTTTQEKKDRKEKRRVDVILIVIGIVQSLVFILQLLAFRSQERTTINAERPHLFWEGFEELKGLIEQPTMELFEKMGGLQGMDKPIRKVMFDVSLKNHGKSPAFLKAYSIRSDVLDKLPEFPEYGDKAFIASYEPALPPGGKYERLKSVESLVSETDRAAIFHGKKFLFVWGMAEYISSFDRKRIYKSRFALVWKFAYNGRIIGMEHVENNNYWEYT